MTAFVLATGLLLAGPTELTLGATEVHVFVDERIDPDVLPVLARPGVVLWVETRSNALGEALLERLALFHEAYVRMRSPLRPADVRQLSRASRLGVWVDPAAPPGIFGPRRLAVTVTGELAAPSVTALRLRWEPGAQVSLEAWARFAHLRMARTVALPATDAGCALPVEGQGMSLAVPLEAVDRACAAVLTVRVDPAVSDARLVTLLASHRVAALEVRVTNAAQARQVAHWL